MGNGWGSQAGPKCQAQTRPESEHEKSQRGGTYSDVDVTAGSPSEVGMNLPKTRHMSAGTKVGSQAQAVSRSTPGAKAGDLGLV